MTGPVAANDDGDARPGLVVRKARSVAWIDSEVGVVALCLNSAGGRKPLNLGQSGSEIWRLIDGVRSAGELSFVLAERYSSDPAALRLSVDDFISELQTRGLVET